MATGTTTPRDYTDIPLYGVRLPERGCPVPKGVLLWLVLSVRAQSNESGEKRTISACMARRLASKA